MSNVLSFDIETKNLSYDIGGWENTHLFKVACVTTWDGNKGVIYIDEDIGELRKEEGVEIKSLRELKYDFDEHFQKGGILLGHNINAFDLPVLRDAMDIYIVRKFLEERDTRCIDTSAYLLKTHGKRIHLDNLVKNTISDQKNMSSVDSVVKWNEGSHGEVADYCLKDSQLTYDLWMHGRETGIVKYFDEVENKFEDLNVEW